MKPTQTASAPRSARLATRKASRQILTGSIAAAVVSLAAAQLAPGAALVLLGNDPIGTSSFTSPLTGAAGGWSNGAAPVAGNTYEVLGSNIGNYTLRAPADAANYTFAGDSLQIDAQARFILKETGNATLTINNFILNGGVIDLSPSATGTPTVTLAGAATLSSGTTTTISADGVTTGSSTLVLANTIGGAGNVEFNGSNMTTAFGSVAPFSSTNTVNGILTITGTDTYTGETNIGAATVNLNTAGGALTGTSAVRLFGGTLTLDSTTNNNANRLNDAANIFINGGALVLKGNASGTAETVNNVSGLGGGTLTVTFATASSSLNAASLTHAAGNGSILVNGTGLGRDATTAAGRILLTTAPTLVGTSTPAATGNVGTGAPTNTKIVPFLVGESTATSGVGNVGTQTGTANTFVTYTPTGGLRPLNPVDEFVQNSTATAGANVRITAATTSATAAINSLVLAGNSLTITDGQVLTVTSGAVLFGSSNNIVPSGTTGQLAFGAVEGMITAASGFTGTITAPITGTAGLTFSGAGNITIGAGAATTVSPLSGVTGGISKAGSGTLNITVNTGVIALPGANAINVEGGVLEGTFANNGGLTNPFGTGTITITPGANFTPLNAGGATATLANPIIIANANPSAVATIGVNSGIPTFSNTVTFAAGSYVPTLKLVNINGNTSLMSFTGGFTGPGNIEFAENGNGSPITLSGTAVNNTGWISNLGLNANANSTATISAAIGSNVTAITQAGVNAFTISGAITLPSVGSNNLNIGSSNTGNLTLANITGAATAGNVDTVTLTNTAAGQILVNGLIADGAGGGKVAVVNGGTSGGSVNIGAGSSTYSGGTTLTGSTTIFSASSTGSPTVTSGPAGTGILTLAGGALRAGTGGTKTLANVLAITADTTFASSSAGADSDFVLSGATTLTGTRILTVNTSPVAGSTGVFLTGNIAGAGGTGGTDGLTKAGPGELLLGGTNTFGGVTTVNAGVLAFQTPASIPNFVGTPNNAKVSVASGATASLVVGTASGFTSTDIANVASSTGFTFAAGSNLGLDTTGATGGVATVSANLATLPANATLAKTGNGTLILSGTNTYTNNTLIQQGILNAAEGVGLSTNSNLAINGISTTNPALFAPTAATFSRAIGTGADQIQITGGTSGFTNLTGAAQTINITGSSVYGSATFNPATFVVNGSTATGTLNLNAAIDLANAVRTVEVDSSAANAATLSGVLSSTSGGAAGALNKTGTGTLNITNTGNTFGGVSTVTSGILSFNGGTATSGSSPLPSASQVTLAGGTLQLLNDATGTLAYGNTINNNTSGTLNVGNNGGGATGATFAFGALNTPATNAAASTTTTFSSNNADTMTFTAATALNLSGGTGGTTTLIANTPVVFNGNVVDRESGFAVGNFDTLALQGTSTGTINGVISDATGGTSAAGGTTPVAKSGTGTWILSGLNTYQGTTSVTGGTLELLGATGAVGAGNGSLILKDSGSTNNSNAGTTVNTGATLAIFNNVIIGDGTTSAATNTGTLTVGSGSSGTLSLQDGTINGLTVHGSATAGATNFLTLGGAAGQVGIVNLDLGANATDQIFVTASAIGGSGKLFVNTGGAVINLNQLALTSLTTGNSYTLLSYPAGETLTGAITLGTNTPGAGQVYTLSNTATAEILTVSAGAGATNVYYKGNISNVLNAGGGTSSTNFTSDFANTTSVALPDSTSNVFFTGSNATNLTTTTGQGFTFNSLSFAGTGSAGTATSAGSAVTIAGNTIILTAASGFTDQNGTSYTGVGLVDQSGVTVTHVISAPLAIASNQSFEIDTTAAPLSITGAVSGAFVLSKTGAGTLILGNANTFSNLNVLNGTVSGTNANSFGPSANTVTLGDTGGSNSATLQATAITIANPIALGTTSGLLTLANSTAAGITTYSGAITGTNNLTLSSSGAGGVTLSNASLNFTGTLINVGSSTGFDTITSVVGSSVTGITQSNTSATSSLIIQGANTAYAGTTTINSGRLDAQNLGATNVLQALGTSAIVLNGGTLDLRADGTASQQVITTGNGTTGNNVTVAAPIAAPATIDAQRRSVGANSAYVLNNLSIGAGDQLNVTGANGYQVNFVGTTTVTGAGAVLNPTTAPLNLLGQVSDGGNGLTVSGTGSTRLFNTAPGGGANSLAALTVNGGVLQGFASAAGLATGVSNSLGSSGITLSGTTPTLRLTPYVNGAFTTAPIAGLLVKGFGGNNPTQITSIASTNFLGATQTTTGMTGNFAYLNSANYATTANGPTVSNLPINAANAFNANTSFQFTGLLNITTAGMYNFATNTDDFGNLFIDGNAPIVSAVNSVSGAVYLTAGQHVFGYRAGNSGGNGTLGVSYQGPDTANAVISVPASAFTNVSNSQLAVNFGNNITVASGTTGTIDIGGNTTVGTVALAGAAGSTLAVTASGDVNTLTTGAVTLNATASATSTLAPSTAVLVVPGVSGNSGAGIVNTLALGGSSAGNYGLANSNLASNYTTGNQVNGAIADGTGGGTVALIKSGTSIWTLSGSAANTYTGGTIVQGNGTLNSGIFAALILNKTPGVDAIPAGTFTIGSGALGNAVVQLGASNQINDGVTVAFNSTASNFGYLQMLGNNETVAGLSDSDGAGVVENMEGQTVNTNSLLTLSGAGSYSFNGYLRNRAGGTGTGLLNINLTGGGTQSFSGANIGANGGTITLSGGSTLGLTGTTANVFAVNFAGSQTGTLLVNTSSQVGGLATVDPTNSGDVVQNSSAASSVLTDVQAGNTTFGGVLQNNPVGGFTLGLTKSTGTGILTLTGANTETGTLTVNAGTVQVSGAGTFGASSIPITIAAAGTIDLNGTNQTIGVLTNAGVVTNSGAANSILTFAGGTSSLTNGIKDGATNSLAVVDTAGATFSAANSYTGGTTIGGAGGNNSYLQLTNATAAGTGTITANSGNGLLVGAAVTVANNVTGAGNVENFNGSALAVTLSGALSYTGNTLFRTAGSTIVFSPNADSTLSGPIGTINASSYGGQPTVAGGLVTKAGANKLTLTGASVYTGATAVQGGTLALGTGGTLGSTAITVSSGATFAPVAGTSAGPAATLTLPSGSIYSSVDGTIGNFTLTGTAATTVSLTSSVLNLELGTAANSADDLIVTGGTTNAFAGTNTVNVTTLGSLTAGTATIITANGITAANGTANFKFANGSNSEVLNVGGTNYLLTLAGITGQEQITIALPTALYFTGQANGNGANDSTLANPTTGFNFATGTSPTGTPANYSDNSSIVTFQDTNIVTGSNVTNGAVTVDAAGVNPIAVVVNNSAVDYTFTNASGSIGIAGATGITKTGTGTLTLASANSYTGATAINGGVVSVGNAGALGTGTISFSGGTLQYGTGITTDYSPRFATTANNLISIDTNGNNVTFASALTSAGGTLTKAGAGTLLLSAAETFSGNTTVNGGTLTVSINVGDNSNGGIGSPIITVNNGGTLLTTVTDALGYTVGRNALVINSGGTVTNNTAATRVTLFNNLTMTGGTLSGTSVGDGNAGAFSLGGTAGTGVVATSDASGTAALISANISTQGVINFNVTRGAAVSGLQPDLVVSGPITPYAANANGIAKSGSGILNLSGANTYKGSLSVTGGTVNVSGIGSNANTNGVNVGVGAGVTGALVVSSTSATALATTGNLIVGQTASGTANGTLYLASGMSNTGVVSAVNTDINIGWANGATGVATGQVYQSAGTLNAPAGKTLFLGLVYNVAGGQGNGTYSIDGGTLNSAGNFFLASTNSSNLASVVTGVLNVSGTGTVNSTGVFRPEQTGGSAATLNATINLNSFGGTSGTLTTPAWTAGGSTQNSTALNFNGGKLVFGATGSSNFLSTSTASVNLYANGGTIDTGANSGTITQAIRNPAGNGVTSVAFTGTSNIYTTPPTVTFSGGTGTNATGYASLDSSGNINGIVVTNGGSFTGTATAAISGQSGTFVVNTASNSTGGLTKAGTGTLTLSGVSTYAGATTVSSTGTLTVSGSLSGTTSVAVNNGGTLILSGPSETLGALTPSTPGSINNSASVNLGGHASLTSTLQLTGTAGTPQTESLGALTLSQNSTIDLGAGATTNNLVFSSLTGYSGANLAVTHWSGNYYDPSATTENGTASQDRLLFTTDPGETFANSLSFYNDAGALIGQGHDIAFGGAGGGYEIVAIPEPSTIYSGLLILGLAGYRERRRLRKLVPGLN